MPWGPILKHWREALIAILLIGIVTMCRQRDAALVRKGEATARADRADSILAVISGQAARVDTLYRSDTVRLSGWLGQRKIDTLWRHDTVHVAGDTAQRTLVPTRVVWSTDSLAHACTAVLHDCAEQQALLRTEVAQWQAKAQAAPQIVVRSCAKSNVIWGALGAAGGYLLRR